MNVYQKLNEARKRFHSTELKKTGHNKFAGYFYFELGDFLLPALQIFEEVGLCAMVRFEKETATMEIIDVDKPEARIVFTSPMGSAALKGCHEVQNIGAVETYQRRYLWVAALEIVEHDALDATTGKGQKDKPGSEITSASGPKIAFDALPDDWKGYVSDLATRVENLFTSAGPKAAQEAIDYATEQDDLGPDELAGLWSKLGSKTRSALKALKKEEATA